MRRRTFVGSLAVLTVSTGCIATTPEQGSDNQMRKTIAVSEITAQPRDKDGLALDVIVVESTITPSTGARIELVYENTGTDTLTLNINPDEPNPLFSEESDPGLVLLSNAYDPTRESDDCWKPEEQEFPQPAVLHSYQVDPGETATLVYDIWAAPKQNADCIEPGDYNFEPSAGAFTLSVSGGD